MADNEQETDTEETTDTTEGYFSEETVQLFDKMGIHYSPDPSRVFNRRKGLHFSVDDGVGIINAGGSTRMIQGYDLDGEAAVSDVLSRAAGMI